MISTWSIGLFKMSLQHGHPVIQWVNLVIKRVNLTAQRGKLATKGVFMSSRGSTEPLNSSI